MSKTNINNIFSYNTHSNIVNNNDNEDIIDSDSDAEEEYSNDNYYNSDYSLKSQGGSGGNGGSGAKKTKKSTAIPSTNTASTNIEKLSTSPSSSAVSTTTTQKPSEYGYAEEKQIKEESIKTKKLTKSEVNAIIEDELTNKKKERLPSSEEVYNRIKFDDLLKDKMDDFIITYEDRFDGLIEAVFNKYEFGVIPLHRIKKIRYLNTTVWDRTERIYDFSIFEKAQQK